MKKRLLALILAAMLPMLMTGACAEPAELTVRGTGIVGMDADIVNITLGVRVVSGDIVEAQSDVNSRMANIVDRLCDMGIETKDINTSAISIYPDYDYDSAGEPVVGYTASNTITVTTRDIENVGRYIDAAFEAGANTFSDISFSASDVAEEKNQALQLAVENARAKAEVLAAAAGMKLDGIISITEEAYSYGDNGASYSRAAASEDSTEVYASELQVSASVTIVFALATVE